MRAHAGKRFKGGAVSNFSRTGTLCYPPLRLCTSHPPHDLAPLAQGNGSPAPVRSWRHGNHLTPTGEQGWSSEVSSPWAHQTLIGWTDDTHIVVYVNGALPCKNGRSSARYYPYSGILTWTVTLNPTTGALNPIGTATYTPHATAPTPTNNYNSLGYEIEMLTSCAEGCLYGPYYYSYPTLVTP